MNYVHNDDIAIFIMLGCDRYGDDDDGNFVKFVIVISMYTNCG